MPQCGAGSDPRSVVIFYSPRLEGPSRLRGWSAISGQRAVLIGRENRWDKPSGSCGGECALQQATTRGQDARG